MLADSFPEMYPNSKFHISFSYVHQNFKITIFVTFPTEADPKEDTLAKRQEFLLTFGKIRGIDPLQVKQWHRQLPSFRAYGVIVCFHLSSLSAYLQYYEGSMAA